MFICIFCQRRMAKDAAHIAEQYLGVCKDCNAALPRVPALGVFPGKGGVDSLFAPFYYCGKLKAAIRRYKFNSQPRYALIFSQLIYEYLRDTEFLAGFDLITSVPLSRKRLYERGFCQTELLARPTAALLSVPFDANCLIKPTHNKAQSGTRGKSERLENVKNVYLADPHKVRGKSILLLDDVYTTGATMCECAKELLRGGADNVSGLALARAVPKSEQI